MAGGSSGRGRANGEISTTNHKQRWMRKQLSSPRLYGTKWRWPLLHVVRHFPLKQSQKRFPASIAGRMCSSKTIAGRTVNSRQMRSTLNDDLFTFAHFVKTGAKLWIEFHQFFPSFAVS